MDSVAGQGRNPVHFGYLNFIIVILGVAGNIFKTWIPASRLPQTGTGGQVAGMTGGGGDDRKGARIPCLSLRGVSPPAGGCDACPPLVGSNPVLFVE